jgi:hypothetical protein
MHKDQITMEEIRQLYAGFDAPIAAFDCGKKCSPYNDGGKPFCCDICVAVPTLYQSEWNYVRTNTDLWFEWKAESCTATSEEAAEEVTRLKTDTPDSMVLAECLGPSQCQRNYRGLTCRQFPFFPYIDSQGKLLGLSYYWEYEEQCWVISNLHVVSQEYQRQFLAAFEFIFNRIPDEIENYRYHSEVMRDTYNEKRRAIPLLHRNGCAYKISTHNERKRRVPLESLPKFGPYKLAAQMPFPEESE